MKFAKSLLVFLLLCPIAACSLRGSRNREIVEEPQTAASVPQSANEDTAALRGEGTIGKIAPAAKAPQPSDQAATSPVSLQAADNIQNQPQLTERKIIRNGEMILESDDPTEGQRKIASLAESLGGFVVTSEFKQNDARVLNKPSQIVIVTVRVPAPQFDAAVQAIRQTGSRVLSDKTTGQDVTEEYIDLEARIRAKKALEAQFLEIMKRASRVSDALDVQEQISEVRSQIESLEGRRRFLENRAALSTIAVTLQTPTPVVTATTRGFWYDVKRAFGDGIDTAAAIITGLIQFVIVLLPIAIFIGLPGFFLLRFLFRRIKWRPRKKEPKAVESQA